MPRTIVIIIFACLFFSALSSIAYITFDTDYKLKKATNYFLTNDDERAHNALLKIRSSLTDEETYLYTSYILLSQNEYEQYHEQLHLALENAVSHKNTILLPEIHISNALSAILVGHNNELSEALDTANTIAPDNGYTQFLTGVQFYQNGDYSSARTLLENHKPFSDDSPWLKKTFNVVFNQTWKNHHIARCYIEEKQYSLARDLLLKIDTSISNKEQDNLSFLLGLSYASEGASKPLASSLTYYKQAYHYFEDIDINSDQFSPEKYALTNLYSIAASKHVEQHLFHDIDFFVEVFSQWNAKKELQRLTVAIAQTLESTVESDDKTALQKTVSAIHSSITDIMLINDVLNSLSETLLDSLYNGNIIRAHNCWTVISYLNPSCPDITNETILVIIKALSSDTEALSATTPLVKFWSDIENDHMKRYEFSIKLISLANTLWEQHGEEIKATNLMKLSNSITSGKNQEKLLGVLTEALKDNLEQALHDDDIDKILLIYNMVTDLDLAPSDFFENNDVADQLGDAQYLFKVKRYAEAQKRAQFVLKIDPSNQQALHLAGVINYYNNDYRSAAKSLAALTTPNNKAQELLGISYILTNSPSQGIEILESLSNQHQLSDKAYILLGYIAQMRQRPEDSMAWFLKVRRPSNEIYVNLCYAAHELCQWDTALSYFSIISNPYSKLPHLKALAGHCLAATGDLDGAERLITSSLKNKTNQTINFSPLFSKFYKKNLRKNDPLFFAAMFFKDYRKDYSKALTYFNSISSDSCPAILEKGETLYKLNRPTEALANLKIAAHISKSPYTKSRAQLLIGKILLHEKNHNDAIHHLELAIKLSPSNSEALKTLFECLQYKVITKSRQEYSTVLEQNSAIHTTSLKHNRLG